MIRVHQYHRQTDTIANPPSAKHVAVKTIYIRFFVRFEVNILRFVNLWWFPWRPSSVWWSSICVIATTRLFYFAEADLDLAGSSRLLSRSMHLAVDTDTAAFAPDVRLHTLWTVQLFFVAAPFTVDEERCRHQADEKHDQSSLHGR